MSQPIRLSAEAALTALLEHPHYRYRGCAPDPDDPRVAAGDNSVSVDAWQAPDVDGGEAREVREAREAAAIDVCVGCPVMVQCLAYGSSLTPEGKLPEPYAILGGRTALERTKALVRERQAAPVPVAVSEPVPVEQLRTEQKLAVLRGLARFAEPERVAVAAGLGDGLEGLRTAKWQIARLKTQLGLPKSATRVELLDAAVDRGLLDRSEVAAAAAGPGAAVPAGSSLRRPKRRRGSRARVQALRVLSPAVRITPDQLPLFDLDQAAGASVTTLYPTTNLETAA
ncbi:MULTISPECIES: hypothetical protein [Streptomyces rochei group]|uniref:hypothetical protein n=1 Tax=Streptomyces rochei group TaxID=2867164 RepID=UPI001876A872|nr:hypothetical protein [Streptomyces vinaceusdrappus]GHC37135.1 hypothetical protein GCM10010308_64610 [Streptomyces vinaceusdrappus]